jgi:type II secretory pathway pseudopilin PulG
MSRRSGNHATALLQKRRRQGGYTLIELTVSLVAGLIVAMGIMTLSREATRTFNEEARSSAAEATLRSAIDRLRGDLARAAYMSTGNIMGDPMIAKAPGSSNVLHVGPGVPGILHLASINLTSGGSVATSGLALSSVQTPALAPDSFDIAGNMTSAEQFEVQMIVPSTSNCTQILLSTASSAMYRIAATGLGTAAAAQELRNAFQPVPAAMTNQFIVRLVDTTGHTQYLATCPGANAAGFTGTQPWVSISTADTPIQYAAQTKTQGGVTGYCVGCIVNPVQIVRWEITTSTNELTNQAQYAAGLDSLPANASTAPTIDPNKYDLMRTYVDATWTPVYATSEIVAEYAADLELAFSVDNTILGDQFPSIVTFAFDDSTDNKIWGADVSKSAFVSNQGPQRIRSARVRLVTRAAQADRTVNVPVTNFGSQEFMYRYCINSLPSCATNDQTLRWARARTVTAEVALPNASQDFF